MQQLCCWKRVDRSGERGSRRHWWADNAPSLMMMLMIIMILTLMMLTFVTIMMGREALEGMYWWADKTDDFNEMTIVTIVTTVMTTKVTRNLATSFRSEWVEWRRAEPAAFKWSQSH